MTRTQRASRAMRVVGVASSRSCRRWWRFYMAPLCDSYRGLSLNRFLAVLFGVASTHNVFVHDKALTAGDVAMATVAGALALGKDAFIAFVNRGKAAE